MEFFQHNWSNLNKFSYSPLKRNLKFVKFLFDHKLVYFESCCRSFPCQSFFLILFWSQVHIFPLIIIYPSRHLSRTVPFIKSQTHPTSFISNKNKRPNKTEKSRRKRVSSSHRHLLLTLTADWNGSNMWKIQKKNNKKALVSIFMCVNDWLIVPIRFHSFYLNWKDLKLSRKEFPNDFRSLFMVFLHGASVYIFIRCQQR